MVTIRSDRSDLSDSILPLQLGISLVVRTTSQAYCCFETGVPIATGPVTAS